jgi:hypothetical protein
MTAFQIATIFAASYSVMLYRCFNTTLLQAAISS